MTQTVSSCDSFLATASASIGKSRPTDRKGERRLAASGFADCAKVTRARLVLRRLALPTAAVAAAAAASHPENKRKAKVCQANEVRQSLFREKQKAGTDRGQEPHTQKLGASRRRRLGTGGVGRAAASGVDSTNKAVQGCLHWPSIDRWAAMNRPSTQRANDID